MGDQWDILSSEVTSKPMREFKTGATRSPLGDKLQYIGFYSPKVMRRFAQYMHKHRVQEDGKLRAPDNWKKGIDFHSYLDSQVRHNIDFWDAVEDERWDDAEELACAMMFNLHGFIFEKLKGRVG